MIFNDIYNEKIIPDEDGFFYPNLENTFCMIIYIILIFYISKIIINSDSKVNTIFIFVIIFFFIILYIDEKLNTNKKFSNTKINFDIIKSTLNTGDFIMFRSYESNNIYDLTLFKVLSPIFQGTYFTHIGMIYKDTIGNIYILEHTWPSFYCNLTKKIKTGSLLSDFYERINNLRNYRIHIVKNNLHKYINMDRLNQSINKYKEYSFFQDRIFCVNYVMKILEENNLIKINNNYIIPPLYEEIINKDLYCCDVEFEKPIIIKDIIED